MKITAITKFKHGELFMALQKLGWTQSELARRTGFCSTTVGQIINLRKKPSENQAAKIQEVFGVAGVFLDVTSLWPECFEGFKQPLIVTQTRDVSDLQLVGLEEALQIPEECSVNQEKLEGAINDAMAGLTYREREIVKRRFLEGKTLQSVGDELDTDRERVRQIEMKALRKLRHPIRIQKITAALRGED